MALLALGGGSGGCHYLELSAGQLALINDQIPLDEALRRESEPTRRRLLSRVPDILHFARTVVQLEPDRSYTGYYQTGTGGVTHVLSASEKTRFEAYTWWFPFAGEVPYKSFFDRESALDEERELIGAGYDTWLGQSTAYSTLGFFRDPLTDTMLDGGVIRLVEVLIHELAHVRLYVPGETDFNEQLASFVGRQGTRQYFRSRSENDVQVMAAVEDYFGRREQLEALMLRTRAGLENVYASNATKAHKLRERQRVFEAVQQELQALYPDEDPAELRINNARLLQYTRYAGSTRYLERLWRKAGRNWVHFWPAAERYADTALPRERDTPTMPASPPR